MSYPQGPFTLAANTNVQVYTQQGVNVAAIVFINESPFTLKVDPHTGDYGIISAFTQDVLLVGDDFAGLLDVMPAADLSVAGTPPAQLFYVMIYGPGETVPGTYPAALARQVNVGNTVAVGGNVNSIINSGEATPADLIRDTPSGFSSPTVHLINTGEMHLAPLSNNVQQDALAVVAGDATHPAVVKMDNNLIATDGAGTISASLLSIGKALGGSAKNFLILRATDKKEWIIVQDTNGTLYLQDVTDASYNAATFNNGGQTLDNGAISTDGTGVVTMLNAKALQMKDSGGTARPVLEVDASNHTNLQAAASGGLIQFLNQAGSVLADLDDTNDQLALASGIKLQFGDGSHLSAYHHFSGTGSGNVATGCATTPNGIAFNPCTVSGSSQTIGGTMAATCNVKTGSGLAWDGTAYLNN